MLVKLVCPVSSEKVDSHISRLTVFINAALMVYFMFTLQPWAIYLVTLDYGIRAFGHKKYSPLSFIAGYIIKTLGVPGKQINQAPKTFASRLGFICALSGSLFISLHIVNAALGIIGFFIALATLDSVFDFCVGCLIYEYLVFPFLGNKAT